MPPQPASIVGIGETPYTRRGGLADMGEFALAVTAIRAAAEDCGLPVADIDGLVSFGAESTQPAEIAHALGCRSIAHTSLVWGGGGGGYAAAVGHAAQAVQSGHAQVVAVYRSICQSARRFGQTTARSGVSNFTQTFGLMAPAHNMALIASRYFHVHRTSPDCLARIAMSCRAMANRNPRSVMHAKPMTCQDYQSSRLIADPLRVFDCCLETDGAAALIVTTRERARDLAWPAASIIAAEQGSGADWGLGFLGGHNMPDDVYATANAAAMARRLFERAGLDPKDITCAQIYDAFTPFVLLALEDYGFCDPGEAADFVGRGRIEWPSGDLPVNTSGGGLSEAYLQGLNLAIEGVRQIRGTSTSQIGDMRTVLLAGGPCVAPTSGAILARE